MSVNNKLLRGGIVVAVAAGVGVVMWLSRNSSAPAPGGAGSIPAVHTENAEAPAAPPASTAPATRAPVPVNITAPEAGATSTPANVAVPKTETQAAPGTSAKLRIFQIAISAGKFIPDTVIVNRGDTAQINFTAQDKDYDVVQPDYGFRFVVPKGATKLLAFDGVTEGKFTIYCESCGGPTKGPKGYIIVVNK